MTDAEFERLLSPVWNYLAMEASPSKCDILFVFGGLGLEIPARAAELYFSGWAPMVLITGAAGPLTQGVFQKPEAEVFKDEMVKRGVPADRILTENRATNTGQNVSFGMEKLQSSGVSASNAILVAKSFISRRCVATFKKNFPNVNTIPCPPKGGPLDFIDRSRPDFAKRMLGELDRLVEYGKKGFIVEQDIPLAVISAADQIRLALT